MAYLEKFTHQSLSEAREKWLADAIKLNFPTIDIEKVFAFAASHIDYEKVVSDSLSYAIFNDETKDCLAVVDIIVSKDNPQNIYIKMLSVDLCPMLIDVLINDRMDRIEHVIDVYSQATLGTIMLTSSHNADIVKLYGRSQSMKLLLKSLESSINARTDIKLNTNWEGNWLAVTPKVDRILK